MRSIHLARPRLLAFLFAFAGSMAPAYAGTASLRWESSAKPIPPGRLNECLKHVSQGLQCRAGIQRRVHTPLGEVTVTGLDGELDAYLAPIFSSALHEKWKAASEQARTAFGFMPTATFSSEQLAITLDYPDALKLLKTGKKTGFDWMEISGPSEDVAAFARSIPGEPPKPGKGEASYPLLEIKRRFDYQIANEKARLKLPDDFGAHRDFAYEWWYFSGHLFSEGNAESHGIQVLVSRTSPPGGPRASYMVVDLAITDLGKETYEHQSFALREREGVASARSGRLDLKAPGLRIRMLADQKSIELRAQAKFNGVMRELKGILTSRKQPALMGENGYSRKGACPSCASHYLSMTRLAGSLSLDGVRRPAQVWFDHEFGTNTLGEGQTGWDWFSLQLHSGWDLMAFQLHGKDGKPSFKSGAWIDPDGKTYPLLSSQLSFSPQGEWRSPKSGVAYPASWKLHADAPPGAQIAVTDFEVVPKLAGQEFLPGNSGNRLNYWEGTCDVRSSNGQGKSIGVSYLEMNGYDPSRLPRF